MLLRIYEPHIMGRARNHKMGGPRKNQVGQEKINKVYRKFNTTFIMTSRRKLI